VLARFELTAAAGMDDQEKCPGPPGESDARHLLLVRSDRALSVGRFLCFAGKQQSRSRHA
jgi:hypothetical protein